MPSVHFRRAGKHSLIFCRQWIFLRRSSMHAADAAVKVYDNGMARWRERVPLLQHPQLRNRYVHVYLVDVNACINCIPPSPFG